MLDTAVAQREVLERLLSLTGQQARALDAGDMAALTKLSRLRSETVKDAAAVLPPCQAWDQEVMELVSTLQGSMACLQQSIRACIAVVRRQLAQLTERSQASRYLTGTTASGYQGSWKV
jgi:hypothetical protein